MSHLAEEPVRPVERGRNWKFDPTLFAQRPLLRDLLAELRCRTAFIRRWSPPCGCC